jgi:hypothetical protein
MCWEAVKFHYDGERNDDGPRRLSMREEIIDKNERRLLVPTTRTVYR